MFELKTNEDLKDYYRRYKYLLEIKHEVDPYIPNNSGIDSFNRNDYGWPVQFQFSILRDVISETVRIFTFIFTSIFPHWLFIISAVWASFGQSVV